MSPEWGLDAPGSGVLRPRPIILENKFVRARFSGIRAALFDDMMEVIGVFRGEPISGAQRQQRRAALRNAFERYPIPVIDLFWAASDAAAQKRRDRTLRLHHWFRLNLSSGGAERADKPVFIGEPDAGRPIEPEFESGRLVGMRALSPQEEEPLRDIFSLIFVPDADLEEDPGGASTPPPPDDDDGPQGVAVAVVLADDEEQKEPTVEEIEQAGIQSTSHDRVRGIRSDKQQFVTVRR